MCVQFLFISTTIERNDFCKSLENATNNRNYLQMSKIICNFAA